MKKPINQTNNENIQFNANKPRPEIRDDLNSQSNGPSKSKGKAAGNSEKQTGKSESGKK